MLEILIADDNKQITEILREYAEDEGFKVTIAHTGKEAYEAFLNNNFAMLLLDVMMPEMDGFTVCRKIRETSMVPIIIITARGEDYERIMGLEIGADDYIVKPFVPGEVMVRIKAILRRINSDKQATDKKLHHHYDNLEVNLDSFSVTINNQPVALTKKEIEILWVLLQYPNKVFTRDNLLETVWGYDYYGDTRTVDTHIKRLRAKLDEHEHPAWSITTVWGLGYKLEVKDE